jgi:hypothetical protein
LKAVKKEGPILTTNWLQPSPPRFRCPAEDVRFAKSGHEYAKDVVMVHGSGLVVFRVANDYAIEERREYYDDTDDRPMTDPFSLSFSNRDKS